MLMSMLGGKSNSFRPTKNHAARALNISEYTKKSLGLGNIRQAVQLPDGEDKKEWLAANTVDFFNEISLLWGIITETGVPSKAPGEGFPPGFEYSWADGVKIKKPIQCSGPAYVEYVITWIEEMINDETLFPISNDVPFPKQFETVQKKIYSRMFRVFAIIYSNHLMSLESLGATAHLNSSFKHFMFFVWEFGLVEEKEFSVLQELVLDVREKYESS